MSSNANFFYYPFTTLPKKGVVWLEFQPNGNFALDTFLFSTYRKRLILTPERKVLQINFLFWPDNISHSAKFVPLTDLNSHFLKSMQRISINILVGTQNFQKLRGKWEENNYQPSKSSIRCSQKIWSCGFGDVLRRFLMCSC